MAYTPTTNFGLKKPPLGDPADIRLENDNMDSIDTIMHQNRLMLAEPFDQTKDYAKGKMVVYEGASYKFITNHTAGNWDASEVEPMPVADGATGGGSDVTKRVTGNPVEFSDGADAPLVKCTTAITGSQDLHGYDKPWVGGAVKNKYGNGDQSFTQAKQNIELLTPLSAGTYIFGALVESSDTDNTDCLVQLVGSGGAILASGRISRGVTNRTYLVLSWSGNDAVKLNLYAAASYVNGAGDTASFADIQIESGYTATAYAPYSNICPITAYTESTISVDSGNLANWTLTTYANATPTELKKGTYTVSIGTPLSGQNWYINAQKSDTTYCSKEELGLNDFSNSSITGVYYGAGSSSYVTFTIPEDGVTVKIGSPGGNGQDVMLERGSTKHSYIPYATPSSHTATFSQSIYQGNADFVGESATSNYKIVDLGDFTYYEASTNVYASNSVLSDCLMPSSNDQVADCLCSAFEVVARNNISIGKIAINTNGRIIVSLNTSDLISDLTGVQFVYRLATPTTETITPTNLPIKSLFGYNHIESSTGDMEVEYITEEYQPLVDLIDSSGGGSSYQCDLLYGNESDWSYVDFKPSATQTVELAHAYTDYDVLVIVCTGASYGAYVAHVPVLVRAIKDASGTKNGLMCISFNIWLAPAFSVVDSTHLKMEGMDSNNPMRLYRIYGMKW